MLWGGSQTDSGDLQTMLEGADTQEYSAMG